MVQLVCFGLLTIHWTMNHFDTEMIEIRGVPSARGADVREVNAVVTANGHTESLAGITYPATIAEVEDIA